MAYSLVIPPDLISKLYLIRQKIDVSIRKQIIVSIKKNIKEQEGVLSMESYKIDEDMLEKIKALKLPEKKENNEYILLHVHGDNIRAPETFNAKVYSGKKGLKLVTNDYHTLQQLIEGKANNHNDFDRIISIDDSGWGFPALGVLVGMHDSKDNSLHYAEVPVEFFQKDNFAQKIYLDEYARKGITLLNELLPIDKKKTLIKICTGFVNTKLKDALRATGYIVEVAKIKEPLQSALENKHKEYVKERMGVDLYYDPKEHNPAEISSFFDKVVTYLKNSSKMNLAKAGWEYFK